MTEAPNAGPKYTFSAAVKVTPVYGADRANDIFALYSATRTISGPGARKEAGFLLAFPEYGLTSTYDNAGGHRVHTVLCDAPGSEKAPEGLWAAKLAKRMRVLSAINAGEGTVSFRIVPGRAQAQTIEWNYAPAIDGNDAGVPERRVLIDMWRMLGAEFRLRGESAGEHGMALPPATALNDMHRISFCIDNMVLGFDAMPRAGVPPLLREVAADHGIPGALSRRYDPRLVSLVVKNPAEAKAGKVCNLAVRKFFANGVDIAVLLNKLDGALHARLVSLYGD